MGRAPTPDRAPTGIINVGPEPGQPVFVDPGGKRRRRLRRITYLVVAALLVALLLLWVSQLGGPVRPPSTRPCATVATAGAQGTDCRR